MRERERERREERGRERERYGGGEVGRWGFGKDGRAGRAIPAGRHLQVRPHGVDGAQRARAPAARAAVDQHRRRWRGIRGVPVHGTTGAPRLLLTDAAQHVHDGVGRLGDLHGHRDMQRQQRALSSST